METICACTNMPVSGGPDPACPFCRGRGVIEIPEQWTPGPVMQRLGIGPERDTGAGGTPEYTFPIVPYAADNPGITWQVDIAGDDVHGPDEPEFVTDQARLAALYPDVPPEYRLGQSWSDYVEAMAELGYDKSVLDMTEAQYTVNETETIENTVHRLGGQPKAYTHTFTPAQGSYYTTETGQGRKTHIIIRGTLYTLMCPRHDGDLLDPVVVNDGPDGRPGLVCSRCVADGETFIKPEQNPGLLDRIMFQVADNIECALDRLGPWKVRYVKGRYKRG